MVIDGLHFRDKTDPALAQALAAELPLGAPSPRSPHTYLIVFQVDGRITDRVTGSLARSGPAHHRYVWFQGSDARLELNTNIIVAIARMPDKQIVYGSLDPAAIDEWLTRRALQKMEG